MYFETSIIRNNKIIAEFDLYPNEDLSLYLRSHNRIRGDDQWFCISDLTDTDIQTIMSLCKNEEEKRLLGELKKGDMIDILLHFSVYIKR